MSQSSLTSRLHHNYALWPIADSLEAEEWKLEAEELKINPLAAVPLLLALMACSDGASFPQAEPVIERSAEIASYRFEVASSNPIEHGERLSAVLGCIGCHTPNLTGEDWSDPDLGVLWTANLTHSAADNSEDDLTVMITEGKRPDRPLLDMPSYLFSEIHPADLAALFSYLKTLPTEGAKRPEPTIGPRLAEDIANGDFEDSVQWVAKMKGQAPPDLGPDHAFARFILRATCAECHGMNLEGSTEELMDAPPRPSLRIVGAYSAEDFFTLMKTGTGMGDRELELMGGVSRWRYSRFTDSEINAVYEYLSEFAQQIP